MTYLLVLINLFHISNEFYVSNEIKNYNAIYIEIIYKKDNKRFISGEFLMDTNSVINYLRNPEKIWLNKSYNRLFNYSEFYFQRIPKSEYPLDVKSSGNKINLEHKVSLYRCDNNQLKELYQSTINKDYFFSIKKVIVDVENIGSAKEFYRKKYDLEFMNVDGRYIYNKSDTNFLLKKIHCQKDINFSEFSSYIKKIDLYYYHKLTNYCDSVR